MWVSLKLSYSDNFCSFNMKDLYLFLVGKLGFKFLPNKVNRLKKHINNNITKIIDRPSVIVEAQPKMLIFVNNFI